MCKKKELSMIENEHEIPYFGKCFIFSVNCGCCGYHQADVEAVDNKEPCKIEFEIQKSDDLKVRIVKSSQATVKIPSLRMSVEPAVASNGYVTNVEGILNRFKKILEQQRDNAEDPKIRKKAKNLLKRMRKIESGDEKVKMVIEDPTGNSAIISEKAVVSKLKVKKSK